MNRVLLQEMLTYLARREYSAQELTEKLIRKKYAELEIQNTLEYLQSKNLQSDARFAEQIVRHRVNQGYGYLKIFNELKLHKLDEFLISEVISGIDWCECLQNIVQKKLKSYDVTTQKGKLKFKRYLLNRGFTNDELNKVVELVI